MRVWELHPPVGRPLAPWPFIEAIRAPALAVLTAAIALGLEVDRDDPDYQDGIENFPDLEDRIRLAIVVARCGLFCAQVEADVKNRVYPGTRNDPDTFWPHGVQGELTRHQTALVACSMGRMGTLLLKKNSTPFTGTVPFSAFHPLGLCCRLSVGGKVMNRD